MKCLPLSFVTPRDCARGKMIGSVIVIVVIVVDTNSADLNIWASALLVSATKQLPFARKTGSSSFISIQYHWCLHICRLSDAFMVHHFGNIQWRRPTLCIYVANHHQSWPHLCTQPTVSHLSSFGGSKHCCLGRGYSRGSIPLTPCFFVSQSVNSPHSWSQTGACSHVLPG